MILELTFTMVTFGLALIGTVTPIADTDAGRIGIVTLLVASAALSLATEYRKDRADREGRRRLSQLVSLAEPTPHLVQSAYFSADALLRKRSGYARVDLRLIEGRHFLFMWDADLRLVGLVLFVGDDFGSLVGRTGRALERALASLLLQPIGDQLDARAAYRLSQLLITWFAKVHSARLSVGPVLDATTGRINEFSVMLDAPSPPRVPLKIGNDLLLTYRAKSWPEIGADLVERCSAWLGVGRLRATEGQAIIVDPPPP